MQRGVAQPEDAGRLLSGVWMNIVERGQRTNAEGAPHQAPTIEQMLISRRVWNKIETIYVVSMVILLF